MIRHPFRTTTLVALGLSALSMLALPSAQADKSLEGRACRSVHLQYKAGTGIVFYNEIKPTQTARGTYFATIGFNSGYFGMQELSNGKKVAIFSVWDSHSNNKNDCPVNERARTLHQGKGVVIKRFGGEGSGGQSFLDFDWQLDETYRFAVAAHPSADNDKTGQKRTTYSAYIYCNKGMHPDLPEGGWLHMTSFDAIQKQHNIRGQYSFVEDFRRNRESTKHTRTAEFGNAWYCDLKGAWHRVDKARFTGDRNPVMNINAGMNENKDLFYLSTGGDITNDDAKLWSTIILPPTEDKAEKPADLPEALQATIDKHKQ